ncbi:hypothetical protein ACHAW6_012066 [Cyclotella cf. meneghiniana]
MEAQHSVPNNPLHLLDDFLSSLPPIEPPSNFETAAMYAESHSLDSSPRPHEKRHNLTLRVAADLFGNNISLLESALSLLEEQEQSQSSVQFPIIKTIRAKRSGRDAILVQKQRKNKTYNFRVGNEMSETDKRNNEEINQFYLCLLGRDRANNWNRMQRLGVHCTCRSFFQNIKGGKSNKGSTSDGLASLNCQTIVCKHLLAVILMPHLLPWSEKGVKIEVVDDRQFAKVVSKASIG